MTTAAILWIWVRAFAIVMAVGIALFFLTRWLAIRSVRRDRERLERERLRPSRPFLNVRVRTVRALPEDAPHDIGGERRGTS